MRAATSLTSDREHCRLHLLQPHLHTRRMGSSRTHWRDGRQRSAQPAEGTRIAELSLWLNDLPGTYSERPDTQESRGRGEPLELRSKSAEREELMTRTEFDALLAVESAARSLRENVG